jgi:hypothetical protein
MKEVHPPFQSNWKTWFEIPKMGVIARKPAIQSHARYGSHSRNFPTSPHQEHPYSILFRPDDRTLRPSRRVFQRVPKVRRRDG